jgi:hypothetical protein
MYKRASINSFGETRQILRFNQSEKYLRGEKKKTNITSHHPSLDEKKGCTYN